MKSDYRSNFGELMRGMISQNRDKLDIQKPQIAPPTEEDIENLAIEMTKNEMIDEKNKDSKEMVHLNAREVNQRIRARFELVKRSRDTGHLKNTIWANWTLGDCLNLLEKLESHREVEKRRNVIWEIIERFEFSGSYEEQLKQLQDYLAMERTQNAWNKLMRLADNLDHILHDEKVPELFLLKYANWSKEDIFDFLSIIDEEIQRMPIQRDDQKKF